LLPNFRDYRKRRVGRSNGLAECKTVYGFGERRWKKIGIAEIYFLWEGVGDTDKT
jgi:hypothetical protein